MISIILTILILTTQSVSSQNECPKCGPLQVPYPLSTKENCGNSDYKIYCNNETLQFKSSSGDFYYNIQTINPTTFKLVITPPKIQDHTCFSPDLSLGGLRLDENSPFNISTHNTVMLLNCSQALLFSPLNCTSGSLCRQFEDREVTASGCKNTLCCTYLKDSAMTSHFIRVRIGGCTAYTSVVDIKPGDGFGSWKYGIELQWAPPN